MLNNEQRRIIDEMEQLKTLNERNHFLQERFKLLGCGSSRAAYMIDDNVCLKVAISEAGLAQNQKEANTSFKNHLVVA